ncbi:alpha/beta-hydrolase [Eremomyces bilateralis CBS 781.70]|uniref:Carboxylic ester hydrolase n=1 Tax=Eremomyces bilateralis CBS 781.70 TaxID=1392243 RepID=A0A6G1FWC9_9PEZI|nr:alpha/beta-hydrolase [Eremomyces bilateralis CBS 781.70]KAF1810002.1 alpha/beta-hydrolase [Eremomyces bilateralis CBS 781.70]
MFLTLLACLTSTAVAGSLIPRAGTSVTISNGTVFGSSSGGVESFMGIPYAQPPTGSLRLKPPKPLATSFGTIDAIGVPQACPQFLGQLHAENLPLEVLGLLTSTPIFADLSSVAGEDCLTINVQRPEGTSYNAELPVVIWIHGGGFEIGATQVYDGSIFVNQSISMNNPVIYVAMNYRLGGFGFLAGSQVKADGSANLGLRDQRLAIQWVQDNIGAFGGDPTKVTLWGESAGALSVLDHTIINGGDISYNGKPLFRAAIMQSGSVWPALPVDSDKSQAIFDQVVESAGCANAADSLACLRGLSYDDFLSAVTSVPNFVDSSSVNLSYLPRPDPSDDFFPVSPETAIRSGAYAKVPLIIGDVKDEGTLFSLPQTDLSTTQQLISYLKSYFPLASTLQVAGLAAIYPDEPEDGSPYDTGSANQIYPQFKRLASIIGDLFFDLARRSYLTSVSYTVKTWTYLDTSLYGLPVLGTFHVSDLFQIFFDVPDAVAGSNMRKYFISFINTLDPNSYNSATGLTSWPQYSLILPKMMNFSATTTSLTWDTYRPINFLYITTQLSSFRL